MNINTKQWVWRRFVYLLVLGLISGCASTGINQAPEYSQRQNALLAPGYPVERIDDPDGARLVGSSSDRSREDYGTNLGNYFDKADVTQALAMWIHTDDDYVVAIANDDYIVAIAHHRGLRDNRAYWDGLEDSDGSEEVGGKRFQYAMRSGLYEELISLTVSRKPPECGVSVALQAPVYRSNKATYLEYTEGIPCGAIPRHGEAEQKALRERAYRFFGLTL